MARFFIDRPIFAIVLSILTVIVVTIPITIPMNPGQEIKIQIEASLDKQPS